MSTQDEVRIECVQGDITTQEVDAIVNAANSGLRGGGGVDGAIHRAAGPDLLAECEELRAGPLPDGLPVGEAVATGAGNLPARWVVHTVGPNRRAGQTDPALLRAAFAESLRVADEVGAASVALPAVGAGVYGWSAADAAAAAMTAAQEFAADAPQSVRLVRFVLFSPELLSAFEAARG